MTLYYRHSFVSEIPIALQLAVGSAEINELLQKIDDENPYGNQVTHRDYNQLAKLLDIPQLEIIDKREYRAAARQRQAAD